MRGFLAFIAAGIISSLVAQAGDTGVPPLPASADYPVRGQTDAAKLGAGIVPPNQVSKMFTPQMSKRYIVVEVAIYPEKGVPFDVEAADFTLRAGQRFVRADSPMDVAPWPEAAHPPRLPVDVTAEVGVVHESDNDAVYGRHQGTGTYTGVGVSSPPSAPPLPPDPRNDPRLVYDKLQRMALADGDTRVAIAGYLYFPQYAKRKKSDEIELKYARHAVSLNLVFPKQ